EALRDAPPRRLPERVPACWIDGERDEPVGERVRVTHGDDEPADTVLDRLAGSDGRRRDDRPPGGHRFQRRLRHSLAPRALDDDSSTPFQRTWSLLRGPNPRSTYHSAAPAATTMPASTARHVKRSKPRRGSSSCVAPKNTTARPPPPVDRPKAAMRAAFFALAMTTSGWKSRIAARTRSTRWIQAPQIPSRTGT